MSLLNMEEIVGQGRGERQSGQGAGKKAKDGKSSKYAHKLV
jgi:hypothetical protein